MADSVDRVFVHALNTVKKIPRTGSARPPSFDRLRLYGLYKQAMEGDVAAVMERPGSGSTYGGGGGDGGNSAGGNGEEEELRKEREKWDAWDACKGLGKTEAKRRYIEALIGTMHKYASSTADARELVAELEFVWDQIKNNSASTSAGTSPRRGSSYPPQRHFNAPRSGNDGPMRVISPMSQDDEEESQRVRRLDFENDEDADEDDARRRGTYEGEDQGEEGFEEGTTSVRKWRRRVEMALVRMTAEMAALREQIATGREYRGQRRRSIGAWMSWLVWVSMKHVVVDVVLLGMLMIWLRRRRERRLEDLVREWLRTFRGWIRGIVPSRPVK